jgi:hypothetical protein
MIQQRSDLDPIVARDRRVADFFNSLGYSETQ